jgi:hypothetical protein
MWGTREVYIGFWWKDLKERDRLENLHLEERIILKLIFRMWDRGMERIDLAQDRDRLWALVNVVMNLRVP